jgi:hypothetical protein
LKQEESRFEAGRKQVWSRKKAGLKQEESRKKAGLKQEESRFEAGRKQDWSRKKAGLKQEESRFEAGGNRQRSSGEIWECVVSVSLLGEAELGIVREPLHPPFLWRRSCLWMFGVELSEEVWSVDVVESDPTVFVVWVSFPVDSVFVFVSLNSVVSDFFDFVLGFAGVFSLDRRWAFMWTAWKEGVVIVVVRFQDGSVKAAVNTPIFWKIEVKCIVRGNTCDSERSLKAGWQFGTNGGFGQENFGGNKYLITNLVRWGLTAAFVGLFLLLWARLRDVGEDGLVHPCHVSDKVVGMWVEWNGRREIGQRDGLVSRVRLEGRSAGGFGRGEVDRKLDTGKVWRPIRLSGVGEVAKDLDDRPIRSFSGTIGLWVIGGGHILSDA